MKTVFKSFLCVLSVFGADTFTDVDSCELLREPSKWNGLTIRTRGVVRYMKGEGGLILTPIKCNVQFIVKGYRFPSEIALQSTQNDRLILHKTEFSTDRMSVRAVMKALDESNQPEGRSRVLATVSGVFETRTPVSLLIREDRPYPWYGFAHMGGLPAQIVVCAASEIVVERLEGP